MKKFLIMGIVATLISTTSVSANTATDMVSDSKATKLSILNSKQFFDGYEVSPMVASIYDALEGSNLKFDHSAKYASEITIGDDSIGIIPSFNAFLVLKDIKKYIDRNDFYVNSDGKGLLTISENAKAEGYAINLNDFVIPAGTLHFKVDKMIYSVINGEEIPTTISWEGIKKLLQPFYDYEEKDFIYEIGFGMHGVKISFDGGEHTTILGSLMQILLGTNNIYTGVKEKKAFVMYGENEPVVLADLEMAQHFVSALDRVVNDGIGTISLEVDLNNGIIKSVSDPNIFLSNDIYKAMGLNLLADRDIDFRNILTKYLGTDVDFLKNANTARIALNSGGIGIEADNAEISVYYEFSNFGDSLTSAFTNINEYLTKSSYYHINLDTGFIRDMVTDKEVFNLYTGVKYVEDVPELNFKAPIKLNIVDIQRNKIEITQDSTLDNINYTDIIPDDWVRPFLSLIIKQHPNALRNTGAFEGDRIMTRAEAAKMILTIFERDNIELVEGEQYFMDTEMGSWEEWAMAAARFHGLLSGQEKVVDEYVRIFMRPTDQISKCEFIKVAVNALCTTDDEKCAADVSEVTVDGVEKGFMSYAQRAHDLEAIEGNYFACGDLMSRREAIKILSILGRK